MSRTVHPDTLPDLLLSKGSMSGPHRRTRPLTINRWARLSNWIRNCFPTPWKF